MPVGQAYGNGVRQVRQSHEIERFARAVGNSFSSCRCAVVRINEENTSLRVFACRPTMTFPSAVISRNNRKF